MTPRLTLLALLLLAAGCARPAPETQHTAAEVAACRQHTDEVYAMQNPDAVYRADLTAQDTRDTPFAGSGVINPSQGLVGRYQQDELMSDCLEGGHGTVGAAPAAPPPEETPAAPAQ